MMSVMAAAITVIVCCIVCSTICNFNYGEFATIRNQFGLNSFKISVKEYIARTGAISLQAKAGRYGGTYARSDILCTQRKKLPKHLVVPILFITFAENT